ncbi:ProQ/FinO family protein [Caballeronia sp. BCC1704]|uniref:ProQ/FinO family protein n=1 Tax=Caballeronia sp. BCC1704 TaxID=2676300 RepID=UPI001588314E|nr:ProQ/FinO family protein [Caballeronia sp. BCC1704]
MGFEQLAALKQQLAQQAKSAAKRQAGKKQVSRADRPPDTSATPPVDPVVHTIGKLQKRFPKAFPRNPAPKVALKVGILNDLLAQRADLSLSERELKDAIKLWCRGNRYWNSLVEGAPRVDLTGNPTGQVSTADAMRARQLQAGRSARVGSPGGADGQTLQAGKK